MSRSVLLICPLLLAAACTGCSDCMQDVNPAPGHTFGRGGLLQHRYDAPAPWAADGCTTCAKKSAPAEGCATCAKKPMPLAETDLAKKPGAVAQSKKPAPKAEDPNEDEKPSAKAPPVSPYAPLVKDNPFTRTTDYHDDGEYFPPAPKSERKKK